jgi:tetratricopeptide (TPR) repeat protein
MKARIAALLAVTALAAAPAVLAGDAVTAFQPGKLPPEALPHLQVKAVVAEFLDPDKTELGKEIGYLIWREILTAISDQKGAGVIIAHPPDNQRLVDMIQQNYHQAALQIAESQKARMAVWGSVSELDGRLALDSYLSLVGEVVREELALRMNWAASPDAKPNDTGLSARITRTRFNFPRVWRTRDQLFVRPLLVQVDTAIRDRPSKEIGKVLARARANESLQSEGMLGNWFRVRTRGGVAGYVDAWDVYVPPRQVSASGKEPVLAKPASGAKPIATTAPAAGYPVKASIYVDKVGLWYQIETPAGIGWVRAFRMRTQFSLPVVHFAAGLYRYQLGRYDDAAREFELFTRMDGVREDPASLSTAYQLLGASQLMGVSKARKSVAGFDLHDRALKEAISITPYDPGAYALRAVATLAAKQSVSAALPDLQKALQYDPSNRDARITLDRLKALSVTGGPAKGKPAVRPPQLFREDLMRSGPALREEIEVLSERYSGVPVKEFGAAGAR